MVGSHTVVYVNASIMLDGGDMVILRGLCNCCKGYILAAKQMGQTSLKLQGLWAKPRSSERMVTPKDHWWHKGKSQVPLSSRSQSENTTDAQVVNNSWISKKKKKKQANKKDYKRAIKQAVKMHLRTRVPSLISDTPWCVKPIEQGKKKTPQYTLKKSGQFSDAALPCSSW